MDDLKELKRIRKAYESNKKLLGTDIPKTKRDHIRKKWGRQIKTVEKNIDSLIDLIPTLPMEYFYDLDEEGNQDYSLLQNLDDCTVLQVSNIQPRDLVPRANILESTWFY